MFEQREHFDFKRNLSLYDFYLLGNFSPTLHCLDKSGAETFFLMNKDFLCKNIKEKKSFLSGRLLVYYSIQMALMV